MRYLVFTLLLAAPITLVGWVAWRGRVPPAAEAAPAPAAATAARSADATLRALFDVPLSGAVVTGAVALYDATTLSDRIDGAAPQYLERHFRHLAAAEMVTPQGADLTCEVYDMGAAANAGSIADAERSAYGHDVPGFSGARAGPLSLAFRGGRFYVKLTALDARAETMLPAIGRALRDRLR